MYNQKKNSQNIKINYEYINNNDLLDYLNDLALMIYGTDFINLTFLNGNNKDFSKDFAPCTPVNILIFLLVKPLPVDKGFLALCWKQYSPSEFFPHVLHFIF